MASWSKGGSLLCHIETCGKKCYENCWKMANTSHTWCFLEDIYDQWQETKDWVTLRDLRDCSALTYLRQLKQTGMIEEKKDKNKGLFLFKITPHGEKYYLWNFNRTGSQKQPIYNNLTFPKDTKILADLLLLKAYKSGYQANNTYKIEDVPLPLSTKYWLRYKGYIKGDKIEHTEKGKSVLRELIPDILNSQYIHEEIIAAAMMIMEPSVSTFAEYMVHKNPFVVRLAKQRWEQIKDTI